MMERMDWLDSRECVQCGKEIQVLYPHLWRFKRNGKYLCSWSCLRKYDGKEAEDMTLTDKQKLKACEMALEGKNTLPYLKEIGTKNQTAAWDTCLNWARKNVADYEKLPKRFGQQKKEAPKVELVYDESIAEEYRREQEEKKAEQAVEMAPPPEIVENIEVVQIINGMPADDVLVTAIRMGSLGEFYFDRKYRTIDWRSGDGEEVSLMPEEWRRLAEAIPRMMQLLGVEV